MDDSDIIEVYSAANSIEAYAMANALKAAGVRARVVGDQLETGVPFGQTMTPRIWVLRKDEAHARTLLKEWKVDANASRESVGME
jgi:hypothetical protein